MEFIQSTALQRVVYNGHMQPLLEIRLLGGLNLVYDNQPVTTLSADRLQTIFAYLLLHRSTPQPRHHLAFLLWPDASEAQARTNLRNLLHSLRGALPAPELFLATNNLTVQWRPDAPYTLDVAVFEEALTAAASAGDAPAAQRWLEQAVELYTGDLLPGNYDDWIMPLREDLRGRHAQALHRLIDLLEQTGDYRSATRYAMRLLNQDMLNEAAYVQLMRLHALSGDRAGVRRIYEQCVTTLARELDVEPSDATTTAYQQLLRYEPPINPISTPVRNGSTPMTGQPAGPAQPLPVQRPRPLPPQPTPLVGRTRELDEIAALLCNPHARLVTLVGPGGIGKTRLALASAAHVTDHFPDGVAFAPLAAVYEVANIYPALATALNLTLVGATDLATQVHHFLHNQRLLLVLDNLEQLLSDVDFVVTLLAEAPHVKLLVTSRERLNLQEEWVCEVGGLTRAASSAHEAEVGAALTLFLQTARRTRSNFQPTAADLTAIEEICCLVDGMPLGIELAAAWVHMLSCREIAAEIERNLDFLATPARNVPERHRTLRAVFDHSWQLLSPDEQRVLRQLAVFQGGFTRELAGEVATASLPLLSALVNKSLLRRNQDGRYELHEQVRQYAYRKLYGVDEAEPTRDRHLTAYLALARAGEQALDGPARVQGLAQMEAELTNLRAALAWGLSMPDLPAEQAQARQVAGAQLAATLAYFCRLQGYFREGLSWLSTALKFVQTVIANVQNDAAGHMATPVTPLRALQAKLHFSAGDLAYSLDRSEDAVSLLREGLALYRMLDDPRGLARLLNRLAEIVLDQGDAAQAEAWLTESLALARALNNRWLTVRSLSILADLVTERGEIALGVTYAQEALAIARQLTDRGLTVYLLNILSQQAIVRGEPQQAVDYLEEVLAIRARDATANVEGKAWTLRNLGLARQLSGDLASAVACYQQSVILRQQLDQPVGIAWALEGLVEVAALTSDFQRAARLGGAAARIRRDHQSTMRTNDNVRYEALMVTVRSGLGEEDFATTWAAGERMTLTQAVAYAVSDGETR